MKIYFSSCMRSTVMKEKLNKIIPSALVSSYIVSRWGKTKKLIWVMNWIQENFHEKWMWAPFLLKGKELSYCTCKAYKKYNIHRGNVIFQLLIAFPLPFEISRVWNYLPAVHNWKIDPPKRKKLYLQIKKK